MTRKEQFEEYLSAHRAELGQCVEGIKSGMADWLEEIDKRVKTRANLIVIYLEGAMASAAALAGSGKVLEQLRNVKESLKKVGAK